MLAHAKGTQKAIAAVKAIQRARNDDDEGPVVDPPVSRGPILTGGRAPYKSSATKSARRIRRGFGCCVVLNRTSLGTTEWEPGVGGDRWVADWETR